MNFSLIGTGFIMPRHVEAINFIGGKIIDIVNTAYSEDTWRQIIKNPKTDCIVILTPNDLHFKMVELAAQAGKIVLCEKPLTTTSEQAQILAKYKNVFVVLQLRHHPKVTELKKQISSSTYKNYEIQMHISVHRDKKYYTTWKGQKQRSGGLLFNLGIHYFDLLLYLFGLPQEVSTLSLDDKTGTGIVKGNNFKCQWRVSTNEKSENQCRIFRINGIDYNFSSKDNLSYENLHRFVYQDLLNKGGVGPDEAIKSINLVEKLYQSYAKK